MNWTILWLVLIIVLILVEIFTLGLTTIWFAAGAIVALFASLVGAPVYLQCILFLLVALVLLFFTRPIAIKYFNQKRIKTNAEGLVGMQAVVLTEIDNLQGTGTILLSGQEWSARAIPDHVNIVAGKVVIVKEIRGVKALVEEVANL